MPTDRRRSERATFEEPILGTVASINYEAPTGREWFRVFTIHDGIEERLIFRRYFRRNDQIERGRLTGIRREELRRILPALQQWAEGGHDDDDG
jgi:hypothetical protein